MYAWACTFASAVQITHEHGHRRNSTHVRTSQNTCTSCIHAMSLSCPSCAPLRWLLAGLRCLLMSCLLRVHAHLRTHGSCHAWHTHAHSRCDTSRSSGEGAPMRTVCTHHSGVACMKTCIAHACYGHFQPPSFYIACIVAVAAARWAGASITRTAAAAAITHTCHW